MGQVGLGFLILCALGIFERWRFELWDMTSIARCKRTVYEAYLCKRTLEHVVQAFCRLLSFLNSRALGH